MEHATPQGQDELAHGLRLAGIALASAMMTATLVIWAGSSIAQHRRAPEPLAAPAQAASLLISTSE